MVATKDLNLQIYDILDNYIGPAIYKRKSGQIKCEQFEIKVNEALNRLKQLLPRESMVTQINKISQEHELHNLK